MKSKTALLKESGVSSVLHAPGLFLFVIHNVYAYLLTLLNLRIHKNICNMNIKWQSGGLMPLIQYVSHFVELVEETKPPQAMLLYVNV